ncbi:MAG: single-stranded DNA-binding protein [Rickettsiaceae bacterium]|nr:single-stranded DNA-binding protein [Rickettsiaceae bacterium]
MTIGINDVTLVGFLGDDPEIRTTQNGNKIANFNLATTERWIDRATGEKREQTEWHKIVVLDINLALIVEQLAEKGCLVYVRGKIRKKKWEYKGEKKSATEIVAREFTLLAKGKGSGAEVLQAEGGDSVPFDIEVGDSPSSVAN